MNGPTEGSLGNPIDRVFPHPIPKTTHRDFYDRTRELTIARAVLTETTRKPLLVRGERCVGKTSLLNRIRGWLETPPQRDRFRAIAVEPGSLTTWQEFAQEIWDGAHAAVDGATTLPSDFRALRELRTFTHYLAELRRLLACAPGITFVVLLDELDKIDNDHTDPLQQTKILSLIRFLVEAEDLPLAFVISALRRLPGQDGLGSPLAVEEITLTALDSGDTRNVVHALLPPALALSPEAQAWLERHTGGHPYFVKLMLAMLCDEHSSGSATVSAVDLECAVRNATSGRKKQLGDVLQNVYQVYLNDSEREVLWRLATARDERLTAGELASAPGRLRSAAAELARRGYLAPLHDGGWALRLGWFGDWLRGWSESITELERLRVPLPNQPAAAQPGILIDRETHSVWVDGIPVTDLTALEFRTLVRLTERLDKVVSKDDLSGLIHPEDACAASDWSIYSLIHRLREALGDDGKAPRYIQTVRGSGFRIRHAGFTGPSNQR